MEEVQNVRHRWPESLYGSRVQCCNLSKELLLPARSQRCFEELSEGDFVGFVLLDVRDPELRLPVEGMSRALEDLLLLRN